MQLGTFIELVRTTLDDDTSYTWQDDSLIAWAQLAFNDIAMRTRSYRIERTADVIEDENKYSLDDHLYHIIEAYIDGTPLAETEWQPKSLNTSKPNAFSYDAGSIYLYPTPDKTYTLTVWGYGVPVIPDGLDEELPLPLLVDAARAFVLSKAYEQLDQIDMSTYYHQLYSSELEKHQRATLRKNASLNSGLREIY